MTLHFVYVFMLGRVRGFGIWPRHVICCLVFQPVVTSQMGTINNLIHVKKSDFEVFDALKLDSLESSETSCRGNFIIINMNVQNDGVLEVFSPLTFA